MKEEETKPNVSAAIDPGTTVLPLQTEKNLPTERQHIAEIRSINNPPLLPTAPPLARQIPQKP